MPLQLKIVLNRLQKRCPPSRPHQALGRRLQRSRRVPSAVLCMRTGLSSASAFTALIWQFFWGGPSLNKPGTHVESLQASSEVGEAVTGSGLGSSSAPWCLSLAWSQSGWEGVTTPVRVSAAWMKLRGWRGATERQAGFAGSEACQLHPPCLPETADPSPGVKIGN